MKLSIMLIENLQDYKIGEDYNFAYWKDGTLFDIRGTVTKITWSHITIDVIEED